MKPIATIFACIVLFPQEIAAQKTFTLAEIEAQISSFQLNHGQTTAGVTAAGPPSRCSLACAFLNSFLPERISYPGSPVYQSQEANYWSLQQAASTPICRFSPTTAVDVSIGILSLRVTQCKFAVKSGGHGAFSGASNINGGITIDLEHLNQLTVSRDRTETAVGAGNVWGNVYSYLDPKNLTVIGGRVSKIGVGGLTLGGGISFFSGRAGWACDNVNNYQVVFADGTIHDVNFITHPDLYWALRGGGNNFGIVTRFNLATFPQGDLWAGSNLFLYSPELAERFNSAFYWFNINADPFAALIMVYVYIQTANIYAIVADLEYTKPQSNPPAFYNFTSMPPSAQISNTMRITNLTSVAAEFQATNPNGFRQSYWAITVKNSPTLLTEIKAIFMEEVNKVKNVPDLLPSLVLQPLTTATTSHFKKNGGNALGIDENDGPLVITEISVSWSGAENDNAVMSMARSIITRSNTTAYSQGLGHPFLYQNYAAAELPVFQSYGSKNLKRLRDTSQKYDPYRVWQDLQPGYFKLF